MARSRVKTAHDGVDLYCTRCGHQWRCRMPLPITVGRFVAAVNGCVSAGCPECGAFGADGADVVLGRPRPARPRED
jgi:hypothetical protein